jgi:RNA polymerase sigma-70 factor (ECF subfamily)
MVALSDEDMNLRASPEPSPAAQTEQREAASEILQVLGTLSKNQQEVVRLKFQGGLSYEEIGRVTNLSPSNVGFLLHTALKAIRRQMQAGPLTGQIP